LITAHQGAAPDACADGGANAITASSAAAEILLIMVDLIDRSWRY
jgi:hypothetical protein